MRLYPGRLLNRANQQQNGGKRASSPGSGWRIVSSTSMSTLLRRLTWIVPLFLFLLVVGYQLGPARWIHSHLGYRYHIAAEIVVFATAGPLLAFGTLYLLRRWLEERDTSQWQSQLLQLNRMQARRNRQLHDDTLQVLFAAGVMLDTLKAAHPSLDADLLSQVDTTEQALEAAIDDLRSHLLDE